MDQKHYYNLNLSETNELQKSMELISKEHKDIDILINNAGITDDALLLRMQYSQCINVLHNNLL